MEFGLLQCTGKVGDKVRALRRLHKSRKSAIQIMKVGDMICVTGFHDLCLQHFPRGSFGESCKVGVMKFGIYWIEGWTQRWKGKIHNAACKDGCVTEICKSGCIRGWDACLQHGSYGQGKSW